MADNELGRIGIEALTLRHGTGRPALIGVNLEVSPRERIAVLGASGSGKTSLLRVIAGLDRPTEGKVRLHGRPADGLAPHRRGVAMCFQQPALLPHLSILENIALGRRAEGKSRLDRTLAADNLARRLRIEDLTERRPSQLSGGQRARAALGRALAREAPILLLDEPFSGLDAALRVETRELALELLDRDSRTAVLVTHDPTDAIAFGNRIAVMAEGRLVQYDQPSVLERNPNRLAAVEAISGGRLNRFEGALRPDRASVNLSHGAILLLGGTAESIEPGTRLVVVVQPEDWEPSQAEHTLAGVVLRSERNGREDLIRASTEAGTILVSLPAGQGRPGSIGVGIRPGRGLLFDAETGERLPLA